MDVDERPQQRYRDERGGGPPGELKIKGQAGRQKGAGAGAGASRWEKDGQREGKGEVSAPSSVGYLLAGADRSSGLE
jgi:hypothetical protein